ncbi:MAG: MerR family transcriptional regulator [Candidatus Acidulodesulfobacterium sp.]
MQVPTNSAQDEKYFYKIGEAAKKIGVEPFVIRYWETEFPFLKPYKSKSSHRLYSGSDIEKLLLIKDYLYDKKFTIEGARKALRHKLHCGNNNTVEKTDSCLRQTENVSNSSVVTNSREVIKFVRHELNSLKTFIKSRKTGY